MRILSPNEKFAVLIVEGDPDARQAIEDAVEASGRFWSVTAMADGRFALEHLWNCLEKAEGEEEAEDIPDIVISNTRLPGLDGVRLTRELRRYEELRRCYVAIFSATGDPLEQDAVESAGCDFFLRLPKTKDDMVAALRAIANRCAVKAMKPARLLC